MEALHCVRSTLRGGSCSSQREQEEARGPALLPSHRTRPLTEPALSPNPPTAPALSNRQAVPHLFVDMAEALGAGSNLPAERAVPAVLGAIRQLSSDVGIPRNLKELVRPGRNCQSCRCFVPRLV